MSPWAAPLNFSKSWNYTDISLIFWNLPTFLRSDKPKHWLELVPSRLLSISCPDDLQMLNSRRSCLTSPIVTDGRIYIPSTVSSGDEYILLLHSKYRTEILNISAFLHQSPSGRSRQGAVLSAKLECSRGDARAVPATRTHVGHGVVPCPGLSPLLGPPQEAGTDPRPQPPAPRASLQPGNSTDS